MQAINIKEHLKGSYNMKHFLFITIIFTTTLFASDISPRNLKIDKSNVDKIKKIKSNFYNKTLKLKEEIFNLMEQIDSGLSSNRSKKELWEIFKSIQSKRVLYQEMRFKTILNVRELLPVNQRKYIQKLRKGMGRGLRKMHKKRNGK